jgi:Periplasmic binding protein
MPVCGPYARCRAKRSRREQKRDTDRFLFGTGRTVEVAGTETVAGAKIYFSLINDEGGIHGRKLRPAAACRRRTADLIASDDGSDPAKTQSCFDKLMAEKVFALGFFVEAAGRYRSRTGAASRQ